MGLRMADGQNDGRGVPSKDHARDGYVSHTAKETGKTGQKPWQRKQELATLENLTCQFFSGLFLGNRGLVDINPP